MYGLYLPLFLALHVSQKALQSQWRYALKCLSLQHIVLAHISKSVWWISIKSTESSQQGWATSCLPACSSKTAQPCSLHQATGLRRRQLVINPSDSLISFSLGGSSLPGSCQCQQGLAILPESCCCQADEITAWDPGQDASPLPDPPGSLGHCSSQDSWSWIMSPLLLDRLCLSVCLSVCLLLAWHVSQPA